MFDIAKENSKVTGIILSIIITFILVLINPAIEENPMWYGVVLFKDLELAVGIFFGVLFALKFRDPDESPLKYGIKTGFITSVSATILPAVYMYLAQVIFNSLHIISFLIILGFLLITGIPLGFIVGGFLGWYYMGKERKKQMEKERHDKYGDDFFEDLIDK